MPLLEKQLDREETMPMGNQSLVPELLVRWVHPHSMGFRKLSFERCVHTWQDQSSHPYSGSQVVFKHTILGIKSTQMRGNDSPRTWYTTLGLRGPLEALSPTCAVQYGILV